MEKLRTTILNNDDVEKKIARIAFQIIEEYYEDKELLIVGISKNGFLLAGKIAKLVQRDLPKSTINLMELTINKRNPLKENVTISPNLSFGNKKVILVDDVLNSGKTLMHAASYIVSKDIKKMNTVVLVDRRHRNFPIKADWVGLTLSTTIQEHINVEILKNDISIYLE
ncbi:MAG: phosphoribosyltransferase family protein [Flavobacteriales bacterium]|jgi:pyrimidine operon attenuation protein/uracil phosphoribosyltransferase|nr:phosphoribosyltransferase family protein [Flavobacteriales bacterium]MDG1439934.1 phosphoribosyltransferase family protein [Flavobacteriales bacterium]MDG1797186.1 phosphoribosyltransferase family protein [Flavobacteriales bacterium]